MSSSVIRTPMKKQQMLTLDDYIENNKLMLLIMGPPGAGKSVALLHIAQFVKKPVLYISLDGRFASPFRWFGSKAPHLRKRIVPKRYTAKEYDEMYTFLEETNPDKWGAIIVDPLWSAGAMIIEYSIAERSGDRKKGANRGVIEMPQMDDYKVETRGLNLLMDYGAQIPGHFMMGAHYITTFDTQKEVVDGQVIETKVEKHQVLVAGQQIAAALPGLFDEAWFTTQGSQGADTSKPPKRTMFMTPSGDKPFLKTSHPDVLPMSLVWTDKLFFDTPIKPDLTVAQALGLVRVEEEEWLANNPS